VEAISGIVKKYDDAPDGTLGKGFVNGDFFKLKDVLTTLRERIGHD
jgi:hypothetical protein